MHTPSISSLRHPPRDILVDVLARVAVTSAVDLVSPKLTCKALLDGFVDDYVYHHNDISKIPLMPWKINHQFVFDRCVTSKNPEALFRQGMVEFFGSLEIQSDLANLMSAARLGHLESIYICDIVALCLGKEEEGMTLPQSTKGGGLRWSEKVKYCRNKVKLVLGVMWVSNFMVGEHKPIGRRYTCDGCSSGGEDQPPRIIRYTSKVKRVADVRG